MSSPLRDTLSAALASAQASARPNVIEYDPAAKAGLLLLVAGGNVERARLHLPYDEESAFYTPYWAAVEQHLRAVQVEERDRHQMSIPRT